MSSSDEIFVNLRQKLDILGFTHPLPFSAVPLCSALLEDIVKTTESLRDAQKKIVDLLEEKSCWELGVEPYKCDSTRLLTECNELRIQQMKEREDYEQRICDLNEKVRNLNMEKQHLEEHSLKLQQQLKLLIKQSTNSSTTMRNTKENNVKNKKPFITTVRSNEKSIPNKVQSEIGYIKCSKCSAGYYQPTFTLGEKIADAVNPLEQDKLENRIKDLMEQLSFYKRKMEARDREIQRLNNLLVGGRPPTALAKDCCYKNVGALTQDVEHLQRDKSECLNKIREYQEQMHEAMQKALNLEALNKQLQQELEELKEAALRVETQANSEIEELEQEVEQLRTELTNLREKYDRMSNNECSMPEEKHDNSGKLNKRYLNERLNELTQKEIGLNAKNDRLQKKVQKLKSKISAIQKDLQETNEKNENNLDEEKIRLKSERDFFQKEYLRLVSKSGSDKEIEFLQSQIKMKDEELRILRSELCIRSVALESELKPACNDIANAFDSVPNSTRTTTDSRASGKNSDCIQAVILRAERERDVLKKDLERVRSERDMLREKHVCMTQIRVEESKQRQQYMDELNERIKCLERENREFRSHMPSETQIVLLNEEIERQKQCMHELKEENYKIKRDYNHLRILHEQTEHSLADSQKKLILAERLLDETNSQINNLDSNREATQNEATQLQNEVCALKRTYIAVEQEKDKLLIQLDAKTERVYQLEFELKACKMKRDSLEKHLNTLENQLEKFNKKTSELRDTEAESSNLRQQIVALKSSRDEAIAENSRLTNELTESQAEVSVLKKRLKSSESEIEKLRQQLRQYVQEVKKAEDLLLQKEQERDEMLEHYRSLSHDAVLLEGNNQSLEVEAVEYKRQIRELEAEIERLKKHIHCQNDNIEKLEDKVALLTSQNTCLERQLEEAIDDQRLLKTDLAARKELCDKLDIEKQKLNAELSELNTIRQKLEKEIETKRGDTNKPTTTTNVSNRTPVDALEELLVKTRRDLEEQIKIDSKLSLELVRLRQQNDELLKDLETEREKCKQQESLAHEYRVQTQELRHNLTDDRFRQALSRELSPRFPTQTI